MKKNKKVPFVDSKTQFHSHLRSTVQARPSMESGFSFFSFLDNESGSRIKRLVLHLFISIYLYLNLLRHVLDVFV